MIKKFLIITGMTYSQNFKILGLNLRNISAIKRNLIDISLLLPHHDAVYV